MRTTWNCSSTCCGFPPGDFCSFHLCLFLRTFFFPLDLPPPHRETFSGQNHGATQPLPSPLYLHCSPWLRVVFQEDFYGNFHPGSSKSYPGHLKATDLSILRTQGSNDFWLEYGKIETWNLALFFSPLFFYFPHMRRPLLFETILHFNFFLELMHCFNVFQSAPLHLNHPCVCSQAGGQK